MASRWCCCRRPCSAASSIPTRSTTLQGERSAPSDLEGKRVGIRSFTTTTGAWIRGILANDYGVNLDKIRWVTFEDPHVAEYVDTTERAPKDKKILQMLLDGELDAVLGETSDHPTLKPLFPDPAAEAAKWYTRRGVVPVNHLVVVTEQLAQIAPRRGRGRLSIS